MKSNNKNSDRDLYQKALKNMEAGLGYDPEKPKGESERSMVSQEEVEVHPEKEELGYLLEPIESPGDFCLKYLAQGDSGPRQTYQLSTNLVNRMRDVIEKSRLRCAVSVYIENVLYEHLSTHKEVIQRIMEREAL